MLARDFRDERIMIKLTFGKSVETRQARCDFCQESKMCAKTITGIPRYGRKMVRVIDDWDYYSWSFGPTKMVIKDYGYEHIDTAEKVGELNCDVCGDCAKQIVKALI